MGEIVILGIDTSCDDTSASVVVDGRRILSNVVSSQTEIHRFYGGVVPELASRRHIEMIIPVVQEALSRASVELKDLSAIAVCYGPGLVGSLLVGCCFAKSVSYVEGVPLIGVNHLEGHIFSAFLLEEAPQFPFLCLVVSGGHTSLIRVDGVRQYREVGRTRDDAAGEAYDKVAKLLGLGYPGGPIIDRLSEEGDPETVTLPRGLMHEGFDFSFSGLKTAVRNLIEKIPKPISSDTLRNLCASFQEAVIDVLARKTFKALESEGLQRLVLAGGVAANRALRERMALEADRKGITLYLPPPQLCTDNGAMIASAGYFHYLQKNFAGIDLTAKAYLPVG
jgi:N6-L-threonylcarbamoyladenine synthase